MLRPICIALPSAAIWRRPSLDFWQVSHRRRGARSVAQIGSPKSAPGSYFVHDDRWHGLTHVLDQKAINMRALAQRVWVNVGEVRISD
jgi:hypothetical protein